MNPTKGQFADVYLYKFDSIDGVCVFCFLPLLMIRQWKRIYDQICRSNERNYWLLQEEEEVKFGVRIHGARGREQLRLLGVDFLMKWRVYLNRNWGFEKRTGSLTFELVIPLRYLVICRSFWMCKTTWFSWNAWSDQRKSQDRWGNKYPGTNSVTTFSTLLDIISIQESKEQAK